MFARISTAKTNDRWAFTYVFAHAQRIRTHSNKATHSARRLMSVDAGDALAGEPSDVDREEFARLFSRNARRIYGLIMTLVFNHHDAEEVFQNTNVILWNK